MTELEILQQRFSEIAQQFPGLMHILNTWPKDEKEPNLDPKYMPTEDNLIGIWGDGLVREYIPDKNMKHWLIKPRYASWNKDHASENFQNLAEKAGRVLFEKGLLPRLKLSECILKLSECKLSNNRTVQLWVLVVHELGNTKRFVSEWRDIKASFLHDLNVRGFDKEPLRAYYEVQKDFFLDSSLVISQFLEIEKEITQAEDAIITANNEPLSDKALGVLNLLKHLSANKALTGRQILDELSKKNVFLDQSTLTKSIIPALKPHGVKNKPRIGYYIENK